MLEVKPAYHIFGHIHEGRGITFNKNTTFINVSICDRKYDVTTPIVIDYKKGSKFNKVKNLITNFRSVVFRKKAFG